jgi:predicted RNase H-like nuclease
MTRVAGIDGCRGGWIVALLKHEDGSLRDHHVILCPTFADVLALDPQPAVIAIDIPIGLLDAWQPGGRECDRQARQLLGRRASSIFSPPTRPMLQATHYEQVRTQGLSIQAFNILPKIREVDRLMTPELQKRIYEAHPELAFISLAGASMKHNKKTYEGREERLQVLSHWLVPYRANVKHGNVILSEAKNPSLRYPQERFFTPLRSFQNDTTSLHEMFLSALPFNRSQAAPDDILDAYVLAWTAFRIANDQASRIPVDPPVDHKRLRMEVWY